MTAILSLFFLFAGADLRPSWGSLVAAERAFAQTSVAEGMKPAFLSVLADDSVLFRPRAVPGKKWMEDSPASAGQLSWAPEFADIAAAGDLGYTEGPWEYRQNPKDPPAASGHYITLWRKQPSGVWKVELDSGIGHSPVPKPTKVDFPRLAKEIAVPKRKAEIEKARQAVADADNSASTALAEHFASNIRFYRDGILPMMGRAAARKWLAKNGGSPAAHQLAVRISNSADLAYSYGSTDAANYLRIWRKTPGGNWEIVLDALCP